MTTKNPNGSLQRAKALCTLFDVHPADAEIYVADNPVTRSLGLPDELFRNETDVSLKIEFEQYELMPARRAGIFFRTCSDGSEGGCRAYLQDVDAAPVCRDDEDIFIGWLFDRGGSDWHVGTDFLDPLAALLTEGGSWDDEAISLSTYRATMKRPWKKRLAVGCNTFGQAFELLVLFTESFIGRLYDKYGIAECPEPLTRDAVLRHARAHGIDCMKAHDLQQELEPHLRVLQAVGFGLKEGVLSGIRIETLRSRFELLARYLDIVVRSDSRGYEFFTPPIRRKPEL